MGKKAKPRKSISKYSLTYTNTASLNQIWSVRARPLTLTIAALLIFIVVPFGFWYAMLRYTPMRDILPARILPAAAGRYETLARQVDSLKMEAAINDTYLRNINILLGDTMARTALTDTALLALCRDTAAIPDAGTAEAAFVKRFEAAGRNRHMFEDLFGAHWMTFNAPVLGAKYTIEYTDSIIPCLRIITHADSGVRTAYRGTVAAIHRGDNGYAVIIQHPDNFLTVYRGLSSVRVSRGSRVTIGQEIARTGSSPCIFEIWQGGTPLDPSHYLSIPVIGTLPQSSPFLPDQQEAERQRQERKQKLEEARAREDSRDDK